MVTDLRGNAVSDFTRYWVASLDFGATDPARLAGLARGYWTVENKNHWRRDAVWGEDRSRVRNPNSARALALVRCVLLAPLARAKFKSLPVALETLARDQGRALALIRNQRLT